MTQGQMVKGRLVYQFKITLLGISPGIWRRIQVPESYTFWDLHVAIQDAMGWLDYHLHVFRFEPSDGKRAIEIGIPDEDDPQGSIIAGWTVDSADQFIRPGVRALYEYDFGDGWEHEILLEGILLREPKIKYPKCIGGERACPPEDCGGVPGYQNLVRILRNSRHGEYRDYVNWLKQHVGDYYPYDPAGFDAGAVRFSNPRKRWEKAFTGKG
ncbi:MAG: plasmid pRiA4b ORF-3 family protein [Gammaproteobacteria bacterium]